ncbi:hypothetical protein [Streptomyces broussonetiae]|uniref:Uncharacterized protein n=1 Tax=Streptomyces broussonetiae TaxID=2686304 RepID=A0ABV5E6M9_9ACTN
MSRADREAAARRIMVGTPPRTARELYPDAVRRGTRILRRRRTTRRLLWLLLCAALLAFTVWALVAEPWTRPPSETTPTLTDW